MSERRRLARRLLLQKAILDRLHEADSADRAEARIQFLSGDADTVRDGDTEMGRVRRDKGRRSFRVTNPVAFDRWVQEHAPDEWVLVPQVNPAFRTALLKTGEFVTGDGEVLYPDGVEMFHTEGNLVVSPTEAAAEWAAQVVGHQLGELT